MKAPKNYVLTGSVIDRLEKEAEKVAKLHEKIKKIESALYQIENENSWQNYLGSDSYSQITEEESRRFCVAHDVLNGAYRNRPK